MKKFTGRLQPLSANPAMEILLLTIVALLALAVVSTVTATQNDPASAASPTTGTVATQAVPETDRGIISSAITSPTASPARQTGEKQGASPAPSPARNLSATPAPSAAPVASRSEIEQKQIFEEARRARIKARLEERGAEVPATAPAVQSPSPSSTARP